MMSLNIHSEFSTGNKSVEEIIKSAQANNTNPISITDYYSLDSITDIKTKGLQDQLDIIPGIEIPTREHITGYGIDLTILGYGIKEDYKKLQQLLELINNGRNRRLIDYYKQLQSKFSYLEDKEIPSVEGSKYTDVKRYILKHLKELITQEQLNEIERFLILNEMYTNRPGVETVIHLIKEAGGSPVLKYPSNVDAHIITLKLIIYHLQLYGLEGLLIRNDEISRYDDMANNYKLERMTFSKIISPEYQEKLLSKKIK